MALSLADMMGGLLSLALYLLGRQRGSRKATRSRASRPHTHTTRKQADSPEGETGVAAQYEPEQKTDYTQWENQQQGSHRPNAGARVWGSESLAQLGVSRGAARLAAGWRRVICLFHQRKDHKERSGQRKRTSNPPQDAKGIIAWTSRLRRLGIPKTSNWVGA